SGGAYGQAGGLGRQGAQKIVIFESDGMANTKCAVPTFINNGQYKGYYKVRSADSITLSSVSTWSSASMVSICTKIGNTVANGGYTAANRPSMVQCIGFGFLFEPAYTGSDKDGALATFAAMQSAANVDDTTDSTNNPLFPSSSVANYKIITGNLSDRVT